MDDTYQIYVNRVARMTLPTTYQTQLQNIQKSPKFEEGKAVSFPGYSVITPPAADDSENISFYHHLEACQKQLLQKLEPGLLIPPPPASFHLTVADLIWDSAYREAVKENPNFERQLHDCIQDSFKQHQDSALTASPSQWQLLGLILFPRALGVALVPKDEETYQQLLQLRRSIYQNPGLISLGIEQQYYFTAHITLGYFGDISPSLDRDRLSALLCEFNDRWLETEPQILTVKEIQLRKFPDMTTFIREADWPALQFS